VRKRIPILRPGVDAVGDCGDEDDNNSVGDVSFFTSLKRIQN
jgi:hypothetical protein